MAGKIDKGYISSFGNKKDWGGLITTATVNPATNSGAITPMLAIPWHLRGKMGNLEIETPVAYVLFDDGTGVIIDRLDGEWDGHIDYDTTITGKLHVEKDTITDGNTTTKGNTTTTGTTTTADLNSSGGGTSYNSHTHTCPDGETSGPH